MAVRSATASTAKSVSQPLPQPQPQPQRAEQSRGVLPGKGLSGLGSAANYRTWPAEEALRLDRQLDRSITSLPGIGRARAEKFQRLNVETVRDLLWHVPFRYEDYTTMKKIVELIYGEELTIAGVVQEIDMFKSKRGTIIITATVGDGTGTLQVKWFNNRYLLNHLRPGTMVRLSGKIDAYMGRLQLVAPRFEVISEKEVRSGRLVPIYHRTEGINEHAMIRYITAALDATAGKIPDPLPGELRQHYELIPLSQAIRWLHQGKSMEHVKAAQRRLAFDELLRLQIGMLQQRAAWQNQGGQKIVGQEAVLERFYASLPFELTGAQKRSVKEILADLSLPRPMSRMLQGDVGSGKTAVAATALLYAVSAGFQGSLMAPTEILAEQHFAGLSKFLNPDGVLLLGERSVRLALLTGSLSASQKRSTREALAKGEIDVAVGTHALIQSDVTFAKLGLAIVDEQHRFGVAQRNKLRHCSTDESTPDLLVMSATPIPRSLALTLYGDLDLSLIDEMPPGRQPIVTRAIGPHLRERAYTYIRRQVLDGRQAFVVCPLVEESEKLEARAAASEHRFLQEEVFPEFKVELLHGRMKGNEKEAAMTRFYSNTSQILVSTSVVEVGIDVPNATVMLIEGANRFGLAQLHQFRGRIGRGKWRSLCLLMAEEGISEDAQQRLNALVENADGFALAEEDLKMRGAGDFFGTRQSGLAEMKMANLGDTLTLRCAREAARGILNEDPELAQPKHQLLREQTKHYWEQEVSGAS
jgi:ATP-dependent DNA helicase RecG